MLNCCKASANWDVKHTNHYTRSTLSTSRALTAVTNAAIYSDLLCFNSAFSVGKILLTLLEALMHKE